MGRHGLADSPDYGGVSDNTDEYGRDDQANARDDRLHDSSPRNLLHEDEMLGDRTKRGGGEERQRADNDDYTH